jgi:hypothetical protein
MKATTEDGVFTFEIERSKDKYVGTVQNHNSGAYDTTGESQPGSRMALRLTSRCAGVGQISSE